MAQILSITPQDINTEVNHEPRILDVRLAELLGFARPADIRELIERHKSALERFGEVFRTVRKTTSKGGRPATENYLNEKQACYVCTKSETENSTEVVVAMVETFVAVRHGQLQPHGNHGQLPTTITPDQQRALQSVVAMKAQGNGKAVSEMWSRFGRKFNVPRYAELPAAMFCEAHDYLLQMEVKALPQPVTDCHQLPTLTSDISPTMQDVIRRTIERVYGLVSDTGSDTTLALQFGKHEGQVMLHPYFFPPMVKTAKRVADGEACYA